MKLQNSTSINRVLDSLNIGLESRPAVVSLAAARQIAYELPLPLGRVNSVNAAFDEQLPVVEQKLAEVNEQYMLPNFDEAIATTRRLFTTRYRLAHEPTNPTVAGMIDGCNDTEATGEQLATVSALFNGGDAVVGVESLLYAPCELVAAGLTKASLESLLDTADVPAYNQLVSGLEALQAEAVASMCVGMDAVNASLEDDTTEGEAADKPADPERAKGIFQRLAAMVRNFLRWIGEKLGKVRDMLFRRSEKIGKAADVAGKSGDVDKVAGKAEQSSAEDIAEKIQQLKNLRSNGFWASTNLAEFVRGDRKAKHIGRIVHSAPRGVNELISSVQKFIADLQQISGQNTPTAHFQRTALGVQQVLGVTFADWKGMNFGDTHGESAEEGTMHLVLARAVQYMGFVTSPFSRQTRLKPSEIAHFLTSDGVNLEKAATAAISELEKAGKNLRLLGDRLASEPSSLTEKEISMVQKYITAIMRTITDYVKVCTQVSSAVMSCASSYATYIKLVKDVMTHGGEGGGVGETRREHFTMEEYEAVAQWAKTVADLPTITLDSEQ